MQQYIIRRLVFMVPTIILMTIVVFGLVRIMPGDFIVAQMSEARGVDPEMLDVWRAELGLDAPAHEQYFTWLGGIITGDWGTSFWLNEPVLQVIRHALPISAELGILSVIIGLGIAVPVGIISAMFQDKPIDYVGRSISIGFLSVPNFFLCTLVIIYGAILFNWFPPQVYHSPFDDPLANLEQFLPGAIVLGTALSAQNMRMIRTTMLETLRMDYVRTARAKGLGETKVVFKHALRNALIPVVTLLGFQISVVIGGSVIVETVFSINGMANTYVDAVLQRDYPLVQGILLVFVVATLLTNLAVDLSYSWLDPRIRY